MADVPARQRETEQRVRRRCRRHGLACGEGAVTQHSAYIGLLAKWNRRINLTSLSVDPLSDEAVDRLVMEPVAAARLVHDTDRVLIDLGSGGGSPAIPLRVVATHLRLVMVEVKVRKSAFLRDAVRQMGLKGVEVANVRFEELLTRVDLNESADLVSFRAVRADRALWDAAGAFLRPGGRIFWFASTEQGIPAVLPPLRWEGADVLLPGGSSRLVVIRKI